MEEFPLQIVTPDGILFDGLVQRLVARTTQGDVGILKGHIDYLAAIDTGQLSILTHEKQRLAAVSGGFLSVAAGAARVVAITCEWAEEIDAERAQKAKERAQEQLCQLENDREVKSAELRLRRALNRLNVSSKVT